ncbi:MAG: hypothetical protein ACFFG0_49755 [Candidatus Thorarchaeota archaeon]
MKDTLWRKVTPAYYFQINMMFFSATLLFPFLIFYLFPLMYGVKPTFDSVLLYPFIMLLVTYFVLLIKLYNYLTPYLKTRVLLSDTELKVYLNNHLYIQIFLDTVETIEFIKIEFMGYKIKFIRAYNEEEFRSFLYIFSKKRQRLFGSFLKQIAEKNNIEYIEKKEKKDNDEEVRRLEKKIKEFLISKKKNQG